jgi:hypothetical protein
VQHIELDGTVLLFTVAVSIVTALLFGLVPMLSVSTQSLVTPLKVARATAGGRGHRHVQSALVVALSLLAGTALGLLVARLVLPYAALGASGEAPAPPVRVAVPWPTVIWLELALLGALVLIAGVQVAFVRRLLPAPILRSGEGAVPP